MFTDKSKEKLLLKVNRAKNKLFPVTSSDENQALAASVYDHNWIWHHRYGHLNFQSLKLMSDQDLVLGLPKIQHENDVCESCALGKQHRDSFPKRHAWRATEPLQLVHADVCGPVQTPSLDNNIYFLVFVDDYRMMT